MNSDSESIDECLLCCMPMDPSNNLFCYSCFDENVCNRCYLICNDYIHTRCSICEKTISLECNCCAVCSCQSVDCYCKDCVIKSKINIKCSKCKKNIINDLCCDEYPLIVEDAGTEIKCSKCMY
jgi:hypothetical protein